VLPRLPNIPLWAFLARSVHRDDYKTVSHNDNAHTLQGVNVFIPVRKKHMPEADSRKDVFSGYAAFHQAQG
jgi:hypothetical protein